MERTASFLPAGENGSISYGERKHPVFDGRPNVFIVDFSTFRIRLLFLPEGKVRLNLSVIFLPASLFPAFRSTQPTVSAPKFLFPQKPAFPLRKRRKISRNDVARFFCGYFHRVLIDAHNVGIYGRNARLYDVIGRVRR